MRSISLWIFSLTLIALFAVGCMTSSPHNTLEIMEGEIANKMGIKVIPVAPSPFVEAFIEFAGPHERWMGPQPMVLNIVAAAGPNNDQPEFAQVGVFPESGPENAAEGRSIASTKGVPLKVAREVLDNLAKSMSEETAEFSGCLYPVRVRLVRADGSLLEKAGCRGQKGWPRIASQSLSSILELRGTAARRRVASE